MKMQCALFQIHFLSISSFYNLYFLLPLLNIFRFLQTKLPTATYNSSEFLFTIRCHQILQHHHHRNEAFMCKSDSVFLCACFNLRVTQRNSKSARRDNVENDLTRTTQLTTDLTACCALYSQRLCTRKSNASLRCFGYNLPNQSKTFCLHQLREVYYSSQTTNDQPHYNIQLPNTTYSHRPHINN